MIRRKHSKIDKLPDKLKDDVEQMMQTNFTYAEIADYIKRNGYDISIASVCRHAGNLNKTLQTLRMAQENFRVIMEEVNRYPQLDTSEGIIRLLSHQVLEAINNTPKERWAAIDPSKLIRQATALVRTASYKNNVDLKNKDILDAGFEQVKVLVFEAMAKERPDLYKEVSGFLATKGETL
jgi:hypothetical protein